MPPSKKIPDDSPAHDLRRLRQLLGKIAEACAEGAATGTIITDRNKYARCLSHIAAAMGELPES